MNTISGYINPFSVRFGQAQEEFKTLGSFAKITAIAIPIFLGLITLPFGGIGGFAAFRFLVDRFKHTGSLYIHSATSIGYLGAKDKRAFLPSYLNMLSLDSGQPFPSEEKDTYIKCRLLNPSDALKKIDLPSELYLPTKVIHGSKDGDVLSLLFKGQQIQLKMNQIAHPRIDRQKEVAEILNEAYTHAIHERAVHKPLFSSPSISSPPNQPTEIQGVFKWEEHLGWSDTSSDKESILERYQVSSTTSGLKIFLPTKNSLQEFTLIATQDRFIISWLSREKAKKKSPTDASPIPDPARHHVSIDWNQLKGFENLNFSDRKSLILSSIVKKPSPNYSKSEKIILLLPLPEIQ